VVNQGANIQIAALVFIVVLGGWCMLLIPARTIARGWREAADVDSQRSNGSLGVSNIDGGHNGGVWPGGPEHERTR
jgi:hypothetical protein